MIRMAIFVCVFGLAAAVAAAQDTAPPTMPIEVKDLPKLFDAKKLEDPKEAKAAIARLEAAYKGKRQPEAVQMLIAILNGSLMGGEGGWFGPAESRYTYKWLAKQTGAMSKKGDRKSTRRNSHPVS